MSALRQADGRGGFLMALLLAGAPVIAEVPADLPDHVVDAAPLPGWRRISMMAGDVGAGTTDGLLVRAARYVVVLPLVYRVVVMPVMLLSVLSTNGGAGAAPGALIAAFAVLLNLFAVVYVLRMPGFPSTIARTTLGVDVLVGLLLYLVASLVVRDPGFDEVSEMAWTYVVGSVALLTLARGVPAGLALIALSVPFHILLAAAGGHTQPTTAPVARAIDDVATLVPALCTAIVVLMLVGLSTRLAMGVGSRRGQAIERARAQRLLHDTVLQTLEAMALTPVTPPADLDRMVEQLAELRGIARAQAIQLRRSLAEPAGPSAPAGLGEDLAEVAADMAREGLRARLVFTDVDDGALPEARRRAVRDAVREAMRNTMKHAGTDEVVLRIEQRDGGIAVIARDHGTGFNEADRPPGFGISSSITARLAEVGGTSTIESQPGRGTRVTLWVPL
ncbi:MAG TPA: ATP-binding protein [Pseudonocardiaceae bacterium]|nr:ATP-binding protein [Pseudonocardiaceae bacterium]